MWSLDPPKYPTPEHHSLGFELDEFSEEERSEHFIMSRKPPRGEYIETVSFPAHIYIRRRKYNTCAGLSMRYNGIGNYARRLITIVTESI